eukprot:856451-Pyramimonas_sp.AAC.1
MAMAKTTSELQKNATHVCARRGPRKLRRQQRSGPRDLTWARTKPTALSCCHNSNDCAVEDQRRVLRICVRNGICALARV